MSWMVIGNQTTPRMASRWVVDAESAARAA
jgi:hypothetical protein